MLSLREYSWLGGKPAQRIQMGSQKLKEHQDNAIEWKASAESISKGRM